MKKITQTLVITVLSLGTLTVKASEKKVFDDVKKENVDRNRYNYSEPFMFIERGIEFYVFPNGEFDFNTVATTAPRGRAVGHYNKTHGAPRVKARGYYGPRNQGVKIEHDYLGRVRRVGNVFINYDANGRVKRVGSVYMGYDRYALVQLGGMRIVYDRHGCIVDTIGIVNASSCHYTYPIINNHYQADGYHGNHHIEIDHGNNDTVNDDDLYYYKKSDKK